MARNRDVKFKDGVCEVKVSADIIEQFQKNNIIEFRILDRKGNLALTFWKDTPHV